MICQRVRKRPRSLQLLGSITVSIGDSTAWSHHDRHGARQHDALSCETPRAGAEAPARVRLGYGVVVESVNVSVLLYEPVRSGSLAAIDCLNSIGTASLDTGPV